MQPINLIQVDPAVVTHAQSRELAVRFYPAKNPNQYYVSAYSLTRMETNRVPYRRMRGFDKKQIFSKVVFPFQSFLFDPPNEDAILEVQAMAMAKYPERKNLWIVYLGRFQDNQPEGFPLDRPGGKRSYWCKISLTPVRSAQMQDKFPKFIRRIQDPQSKFIISLGSGGIRLFAHPSLMKFIEILGLRPWIREIWGASGGSVAGLLYAMQVDPYVIEQEGYHLYNEKYSFRFSPSKIEVLKNLFIDGFLHGADHMLKGFLDCQTALRGLMQKYMKKRKSNIPFYCIAYNLKERRAEVLTPEAVPKKIYTTPFFRTDALDAVIASSSIPILYVPKKILRGKVETLYVDGGTTEEVPLISPYRKWIRDRLHLRENTKRLVILSVNLFPQVASIKILNHWLFRKVPFLRLLRLSATYADLVRQARIDEHKGHLLRDKDVSLWELNLPMKGANILDTRQIPLIIETARRSFLTQLLEIEESL